MPIHNSSKVCHRWKNRNLENSIFHTTMFTGPIDIQLAVNLRPTIKSHPPCHSNENYHRSAHLWPPVVKPASPFVEIPNAANLSTHRRDFLSIVRNGTYILCRVSRAMVSPPVGKLPITFASFRHNGVIVLGVLSRPNRAGIEYALGIAACSHVSTGYRSFPSFFSSHVPGANRKWDEWRP